MYLNGNVLKLDGELFKIVRMTKLNYSQNIKNTGQEAVP